MYFHAYREDVCFKFNARKLFKFNVRVKMFKHIESWVKFAAISCFSIMVCPEIYN